MKAKRLIHISSLCAFFSFAVFGAVSGADAKPFNYTATGSFQPAVFVFPDGTPADSITLTGTSTSGPITVQEWASGTGTSIGSCTPPGGAANSGSEGPFADSLEIITVQATGDVLIQNLVSGTECADFSVPPPIPFAGTLTVTNVGGTGKFAGATGTETLNFAGQYVSCGNNGCVGYVTHTETGTVTTP